MTHRSGRNGTPLDARFTNWAKELRKAGYDPALIGYTDISPDPRVHSPGDPALKTYEGVLPGLRPHVVMASDRKAWRRLVTGCSLVMRFTHLKMKPSVHVQKLVAANQRPQVRSQRTSFHCINF